MIKNVLSKTIFLSFFSFILVYSLSAQYITLDYGTTVTDSLPFKGSNAYTWSYSIYKASEIDSVVAIKELEIRSNNNYSANFHQIKVYLMHTTDSVFNNTSFQDPSAMGASLVFNSTFNLPTNNYYNWYGFELIEPFYYNGTDNLMVIWVDSNVYYSGNPTFRCHTTTLNCSKKASNTNFFPLSGSVTNIRPNIRFTVEKPYHNDLSLEQWDTITTYMPSNSSVPFSFKVSNKTSNPQSNFTVKYSIDNGVSWKSKFVSSTLAINTSMYINFNTSALKANMSALGEYKCIAVVDNPADSNAFNDTIAKKSFCLW